MSITFFSTGITIDGFITSPNHGPGYPLGDHGTNIHAWAFKQKSFRAPFWLSFWLQRNQCKPKHGIRQVYLL